MFDRAKSFTATREKEEIANAYTLAVGKSIETADTRLNFEVCRTGGMLELEDVVLPACERAVDLAILTTDAELNNSICWRASIEGFAKTVLPACEHAVKLEPGDAGFRDSRGLARALIGDHEGAIADFQFFVENKSDLFRLLIRKRQAWIEKLSAGENPFDPVTLRGLRTE